MGHLSCLCFFLILCGIFVSRPSSIAAQEVEDEREFDYEEDSKKGPKYWGNLKPEWEQCKKGKMQSPIDLSSKRVIETIELGKLQTNYIPANSTLVNRGHDISLRWDDDAGSIKINGTDFFLQQVHWHSPSEHTINNRRYDLELHMVHTTRDPTLKYNTTVVGVLYKIGAPDPFIAKLEKYIRTLTDEEEEKHVGIIDPRDIKMEGEKYYRYIGSLTVPPCTEPVIWSIKQKVMPVSKAQVKLLREAVQDYAEMNARPIQKLNGRDIYFYNPKQETGIA